MASQKDDSKDTAAAPEQDAWQGFTSGRWQIEIDVQNFIQKNYTPDEGVHSFPQTSSDLRERVYSSELISVANRSAARLGAPRTTQLATSSV